MSTRHQSQMRADTRYPGILHEANPPREVIALVARRTFTKLQPLPDGRPSSEVACAVRFVSNNFAHSITLDQIARASGLSKFHLIRKFRREAGITPGVFLQRFRIYRAMEMLVESDRLVGDVARQVGYKNPAAFSRAFHRTTGINPVLYRQARITGRGRAKDLASHQAD